MKITKEHIRKMNRKVSREIEIESDVRTPSTKVHKSKKNYSRKKKHKDDIND